MGPAGKDGRKPVRARRVLAAAATKISSRLKWFFLRPQNADGERARTERRGERRRSPPSSTYSLSRQDPTRTQGRGERRPASPPVHALASVGNQTYQTILPASQPSPARTAWRERQTRGHRRRASRQCSPRREKRRRHAAGSKLFCPELSQSQISTANLLDLNENDRHKPKNILLSQRGNFPNQPP